MYSAYCRLNVHCLDSNVKVVRATRRSFSKAQRSNPALREQRKEYYRLMLAEHADAKAVFQEWRF